MDVYAIFELMSTQLDSVYRINIHALFTNFHTMNNHNGENGENEEEYERCNCSIELFTRIQFQTCQAYIYVDILTVYEWASRNLIEAPIYFLGSDQINILLFISV